MEVPEPESIRMVQPDCDANFISFLCDVQLDLAFVSPPCLKAGRSNVVEVFVRSSIDSEVCVDFNSYNMTISTKKCLVSEEPFIIRCHIPSQNVGVVTVSLTSNDYPNVNRTAPLLVLPSAAAYELGKFYEGLLVSTPNTHGASKGCHVLTKHMEVVWKAHFQPFILELHSFFFNLHRLSQNQINSNDAEADSSLEFSNSAAFQETKRAFEKIKLDLGEKQLIETLRVVQSTYYLATSRLPDAKSRSTGSNISVMTALYAATIAEASCNSTNQSQSLSSSTPSAQSSMISSVLTDSSIMSQDNLVLCTVVPSVQKSQKADQTIVSTISASSGKQPPADESLYPIFELVLNMLSCMSLLLGKQPLSLILASTYILRLALSLLSFFGDQINFPYKNILSPSVNSVLLACAALTANTFQSLLPAVSHVTPDFCLMLLDVLRPCIRGFGTFPLSLMSLAMDLILLHVCWGMHSWTYGLDAAVCVLWLANVGYSHSLLSLSKPRVASQL